jgi:TldD protein
MVCMISREPTIERLAIAKQLLLTPFGLDETHLIKALAEIRSHGVDDADLYFQTTRSEGWSLEEGIVKTGSFSIDQGVGVRAVSGEKTAFAYSDDISWASLLDAAHTVRSISSAAKSAKVSQSCASLACQIAVQRLRPYCLDGQHSQSGFAGPGRKNGPR